MSNTNYRKTRTKSKINYELPVVVVHRSNKHVLVQVLEPISKKTILTVDTYKDKGTKMEKSILAGKKVGEFLKSKKIEKVVFDRNGFVFSGRVKAVVNGIKEINITI
jgi:large subunit ribosomal protein L18